MTVRRVVPNIETGDAAGSRDFYAGLLGLDVGMDLGEVVTYVSPANPTAQVTVLTGDPSAAVVPALTVEVEDVDRVYADALRRGLEILHPLTDEPWGVRRFFVRDPNGVVVNVMSHPRP